jgi:hypothetical protein
VQTGADPLGGIGQLVGEHPPRVDARSNQRRELSLKVLPDGADGGVAQRAGHEPKVSRGRRERKSRRLIESG